MAIRTKTIEHGFPFNSASVASAAARSFTASTVYMPETSSRTIRSAILEFSQFDNVTVAASTTAVNMSVKIDAVAASAATVTQTITNSGENQSFVFTKDVTSYFVTNFTGTSHSVVVAITNTGNITCNASCKLILTYEFDDSSATTRIKTVKIPIDGNTGNLTTSLTDLGGTASQIPNLSTFCPEASKTFRNIFFEWTTHTGTVSAAASTLDILYNATTVSDLTHAATLISDVFYKRIDDITALINTSATNALQAKVTSTASKPCPCLCGVLVVTYEYDHSSSTTILNSLQISVMDESGLCGGTTTADKSRFTRDISIQEPGTITLVQSGILCTFIDSAAITLDLRIGSQASRTFAHGATPRSGSVSAMRRIDSGAAGGAGVTLARGYNTLVMDWFTSASTVGAIGSNMSGLLYLNYTSDKHTDGDGAHSHTVAYMNTPYSTVFISTTTGGRTQITPITTPIINEANYWLTDAGYQLWMMPSGTAASSIGFAFQGEIQSGEAEGAGWRAFYNGIYSSDAEVGPSLMHARARDDFKRFPQDPETNRLDIETARDYRYDNNLAFSATSGVIWQCYQMITYHSITYAIAGTITGSAGGTVTIDAHRTSDGMEIGVTSRTGNGAYSIVWYDNTVDVYTEAYEDGTHIGRSDNAVAV